MTKKEGLLRLLRKATDVFHVNSIILVEVMMPSPKESLWKSLPGGLITTTPVPEIVGYTTSTTFEIRHQIREYKK